VEGRQSIQCGISTRLVDPLSLIYDVVGRDRFEAERTSGLWERPVHIEHYHEASENMPNERPSTSKSPWSSGSFYLLAAVTAIAAMIVAAQWVSVWALPVIVLGAVLLVTVIGALQLRQDKNLTQERFITLMRLAFAQIPVLGRLVPQSAKTDTLAQ
jgi:hypothetical protein